MGRKLAPSFCQRGQFAGGGVEKRASLLTFISLCERRGKVLGFLLGLPMYSPSSSSSDDFLRYETKCQSADVCNQVGNRLWHTFFARGASDEVRVGCMMCVDVWSMSRT